MSSILDAVRGWSITTVLAIYAAVLSSIALAWNIRTHYEGKVRLKVQGKGGMRIADPFAQPGISVADAENNTFLVISVSNVGGKVTTIKNLGIVVYRNRLMKAFNRPVVKYIISPAIKGYPLPHPLELGKEWTAFYPEPKEMKDGAKGCLSFVVVSHSMDGEEVLGRITGW